jgi:nucleoside-diphosphate-sugar epimerase
MTKKILITGGAGFVGRHLTKRMVDAGHSVTVVDNLNSLSASAPNDWPEHLKCDFFFIKEDCRDYFKTWATRVVNPTQFDIIFHLAAVVGGRVMIEDSPLAVAEDLSIDAEMFSWATKAKPKKIVYFSSSAAYPIGKQTQVAPERLSENLINFYDDNIGMADMSYGWSKLTGEFLAKLAHEKYDLDVVCFRPFSGYGEDQHETYPFPAILGRALAGEKPLTIWSEAVRDFIYIEDCVDGVLALMDKKSDGTAFNLGTGVATSFRGLAEKMALACGNEDTEVVKLKDKPMGVYYRVSDTAIAANAGFTASTSVDSGIIKCMRYLKGLKQ